MTDAAGLQSMLSLWIDLTDEVHPDRNSPVSLLARAAAGRIRRLERVAQAASRLAQPLADASDPDTAALLLELRASLKLLDSRDHAGDGAAAVLRDRRSAH